MFFSFAFNVFFVQPFFKYPFIPFRFGYICIYSFFHLFFNIVYRVYIFFGMYIWNFISLKWKWKFRFFLLYYCYYFPLLMVLYLSNNDFRGAWNSFFFLNYIGKILLCNNNFIIISQCIQCLVSLKNYLIKFYLMCFFLSFFYYYSSCIGAKFFRKVSKHPVYHVHFEQR